MRLERLGRALAASPAIDEWIARARVVHGARHELGARLRLGQIDRTEVDAVIYRDLGGRRGTAWLDLSDGPLALALEVATARAELALGEPWSLPPPAASARVELADRAIDDPAAAAAALAAAIPPLPGDLRLARAAITVEHVTSTVRSSRAFVDEFAATRVRFDAVVTDGRDAVVIAREARKLADLPIAALVADAARATSALARARPTPRASCDVVVAGAALAAVAPDGLAWFAPLGFHADGRRARLGLARQRPGQAALAPGADPLSVTSDGTLPFAPRSARFGELGEPVRRFTLVDRGRAAGLALGLEEAAIRGVNANGGVRNLVVSAGAGADDGLLAPGERPLLEIDALAWLACDPQSGRVAFEVGRGRWREGGREDAVRGGIVLGDAWTWLGAARRARATIAAGWYHGPAHWRLDDLVVR